jgi:hypothetical protein
LLTTEINFSEHAISYETCEYELSEKDLKNILEAQEYLKDHPNAMSVHYLYGGDVKLYTDEEECRIDWSKIIVYDTGVYIQVIEKWSGEEYELEVDVEYLEQKLKKYGL